LTWIAALLLAASRGRVRSGRDLWGSLGYCWPVHSAQIAEVWGGPRPDPARRLPATTAATAATAVTAATAATAVITVTAVIAVTAADPGVAPTTRRTRFSLVDKAFAAGFCPQAVVESSTCSKVT